MSRHMYDLLNSPNPTTNALWKNDGVQKAITQITMKSGKKVIFSPSSKNAYLPSEFPFFYLPLGNDEGQNLPARVLAEREEKMRSEIDEMCKENEPTIATILVNTNNSHYYLEYRIKKVVNGKTIYRTLKLDSLGLRRPNKGGALQQDVFYCGDWSILMHEVAINALLQNPEIKEEDLVKLFIKRVEEYGGMTNVRRVNALRALDVNKEDERKIIESENIKKFLNRRDPNEKVSKEKVKEELIVPLDKELSEILDTNYNLIEYNSNHTGEKTQQWVNRYRYQKSVDDDDEYDAVDVGDGGEEIDEDEVEDDDVEDDEGEYRNTEAWQKSFDSCFTDLEEKLKSVNRLNENTSQEQLNKVAGDIKTISLQLLSNISKKIATRKKVYTRKALLKAQFLFQGLTANLESVSVQDIKNLLIDFFVAVEFYFKAIDDKEMKSQCDHVVLSQVYRLWGDDKNSFEKEVSRRLEKFSEKYDDHLMSLIRNGESKPLRKDINKSIKDGGQKKNQSIIENLHQIGVKIKEKIDALKSKPMEDYEFSIKKIYECTLKIKTLVEGIKAINDKSLKDAKVSPKTISAKLIDDESFEASLKALSNNVENLKKLCSENPENNPNANYLVLENLYTSFNFLLRAIKKQVSHTDYLECLSSIIKLYKEQMFYLPREFKNQNFEVHLNRAAVFLSAEVDGIDAERHTTVYECFLDLELKLALINKLDESTSKEELVRIATHYARISLQILRIINNEFTTIEQGYKLNSLCKAKTLFIELITNVNSLKTFSVQTIKELGLDFITATSFYYNAVYDVDMHSQQHRVADEVCRLWDGGDLSVFTKVIENREESFSKQHKDETSRLKITEDEFTTLLRNIDPAEEARSVATSGNTATTNTNSNTASNTTTTTTTTTTTSQSTATSTSSQHSNNNNNNNNNNKSTTTQKGKRAGQSANQKNGQIQIVPEKVFKYVNDHLVKLLVPQCAVAIQVIPAKATFSSPFNLDFINKANDFYINMERFVRGLADLNGNYIHAKNIKNRFENIKNIIDTSKSSKTIDESQCADLCVYLLEVFQRLLFILKPEKDSGEKNPDYEALLLHYSGLVNKVEGLFKEGRFHTTKSNILEVYRSNKKTLLHKIIELAQRDYKDITGLSAQMSENVLEKMGAKNGDDSSLEGELKKLEEDTVAEAKSKKKQKLSEKDLKKNIKTNLGVIKQAVEAIQNSRDPELIKPAKDLLRHCGFTESDEDYPLYILLNAVGKGKGFVHDALYLLAAIQLIMNHVDSSARDHNWERLKSAYENLYTRLLLYIPTRYNDAFKGAKFDDLILELMNHPQLNINTVLSGGTIDQALSGSAANPNADTNEVSTQNNTIPPNSSAGTTTTNNNETAQRNNDSASSLNKTNTRENPANPYGNAASGSNDAAQEESTNPGYGNINNANMNGASKASATPIPTVPLLTEKKIKIYDDSKIDPLSLRFDIDGTLKEVDQQIAYYAGKLNKYPKAVNRIEVITIKLELENIRNCIRIYKQALQDITIIRTAGNSQQITKKMDIISLIREELDSKENNIEKINYYITELNKISEKVLHKPINNKNELNFDHLVKKVRQTLDDVQRKDIRSRVLFFVNNYYEYAKTLEGYAKKVKAQNLPIKTDFFLLPLAAYEIEVKRMISAFQCLSVDEKKYIRLKNKYDEAHKVIRHIFYNLTNEENTKLLETIQKDAAAAITAVNTINGDDKISAEEKIKSLYNQLNILRAHCCILQRQFSLGFWMEGIFSKEERQPEDSFANAKRMYDELNQKYAAVSKIIENLQRQPSQTTVVETGDDDELRDQVENATSDVFEVKTTVAPPLPPPPQPVNSARKLQRTKSAFDLSKTISDDPTSKSVFDSLNFKVGDLGQNLEPLKILLKKNIALCNAELMTESSNDADNALAWVSKLQEIEKCLEIFSEAKEEVSETYTLGAGYDPSIHLIMELIAEIEIEKKTLIVKIDKHESIEFGLVNQLITTLNNCFNPPLSISEIHEETKQLTKHRIDYSEIRRRLPHDEKKRTTFRDRLFVVNDKSVKGSLLQNFHKTLFKIKDSYVRCTEQGIKINSKYFTEPLQYYLRKMFIAASGYPCVSEDTTKIEEIIKFYDDLQKLLRLVKEEEFPFIKEIAGQVSTDRMNLVHIYHFVAEPTPIEKPPTLNPGSRTLSTRLPSQRKITALSKTPPKSTSDASMESDRPDSNPSSGASGSEEESIPPKSEETIIGEIINDLASIIKRCIEEPVICRLNAGYFGDFINAVVELDKYIKGEYDKTQIKFVIDKIKNCRDAKGFDEDYMRAFMAALNALNNVVNVQVKKNLVTDENRHELVQKYFAYRNSFHATTATHTDSESFNLMNIPTEIFAEKLKFIKAKLNSGITDREKGKYFLALQSILANMPELKTVYDSITMDNNSQDNEISNWVDNYLEGLSYFAPKMKEADKEKSLKEQYSLIKEKLLKEQYSLMLDKFKSIVDKFNIGEEKNLIDTIDQIKTLLTDGFFVVFVTQIFPANKNDTAIIELYNKAYQALVTAKNALTGTKENATDSDKSLAFKNIKKVFKFFRKIIKAKSFSEKVTQMFSSDNDPLHNLWGFKTSKYKDKDIQAKKTQIIKSTDEIINSLKKKEIAEKKRSKENNNNKPKDQKRKDMKQDVELNKFRAVKLIEILSEIQSQDDINQKGYGAYIFLLESLFKAIIKKIGDAEYLDNHNDLQVKFNQLKDIPMVEDPNVLIKQLKDTTIIEEKILIEFARDFYASLKPTIGDEEVREKYYAILDDFKEFIENINDYDNDTIVKELKRIIENGFLYGYISEPKSDDDTESKAAYDAYVKVLNLLEKCISDKSNRLNKKLLKEVTLEFCKFLKLKPNSEIKNELLSSAVLKNLENDINKTFKENGKDEDGDEEDEEKEKARKAEQERARKEAEERARREQAEKAREEEARRKKQAEEDRIAQERLRMEEERKRQQDEDRKVQEELRKKEQARKEAEEKQREEEQRRKQEEERKAREEQQRREREAADKTKEENKPKEGKLEIPEGSPKPDLKESGSIEKIVNTLSVTSNPPVVYESFDERNPNAALWVRAENVLLQAGILELKAKYIKLQDKNLENKVDKATAMLVGANGIILYTLGGFGTFCILTTGAVVTGLGYYIAIIPSSILFGVGYYVYRHQLKVDQKKYDAECKKLIDEIVGYLVAVNNKTVPYHTDQKSVVFSQYQLGCAILQQLQMLTINENPQDSYTFDNNFNDFVANIIYEYYTKPTPEMIGDATFDTRYQNYLARLCDKNHLEKVKDIIAGVVQVCFKPTINDGKSILVCHASPLIRNLNSLLKLYEDEIKSDAHKLKPGVDRIESDVKLFNLRTLISIWLNQILASAQYDIRTVLTIIDSLKPEYKELLFSIFKTPFVSNPFLLSLSAPSFINLNPSDPYYLLDPPIASALKNRLTKELIDEIIRIRKDVLRGKRETNIAKKIIEDSSHYFTPNSLKQHIDYIFVRMQKENQEDFNRLDQAYDPKNKEYTSPHKKEKFYVHLILDILEQYYQVDSTNRYDFNQLLKLLDKNKLSALLLNEIVYPKRDSKSVPYLEIRIELLKELSESPIHFQKFLIDLFNATNKNPNEFIKVIGGLLGEWEAASLHKDDLIIQMLQAFSKANIPFFKASQYKEVLSYIMAAYDQDKLSNSNFPPKDDCPSPIVSIINTKNPDHSDCFSDKEKEHYLEVAKKSAYQILLAPEKFNNIYKPTDIRHALEILIPPDNANSLTERAFQALTYETLDIFFKHNPNNLFDDKNACTIFDKIMIGLERTQKDNYSFLIRTFVIKYFSDNRPAMFIKPSSKTKESEMIRNHIALWLSDAVESKKVKNTTVVDLQKKYAPLLHKSIPIALAQADTETYRHNTLVGETLNLIVTAHTERLNSGYPVLCDLLCDVEARGMPGAAGTVANAFAQPDPAVIAEAAVSDAAMEAPAAPKAGKEKVVPKSAFIETLFKNAAIKIGDVFTRTPDVDAIKTALQKRVDAQITLASMLYDFYQSTMALDPDATRKLDNFLCTKIHDLIKSAGLAIGGETDLRVLCAIAILKSPYEEKVRNEILTQIFTIYDKDPRQAPNHLNIYQFYSKVQKELDQLITDEKNPYVVNTENYKQIETYKNTPRFKSLASNETAQLRLWQAYFKDPKNAESIIFNFEAPDYKTIGSRLCAYWRESFNQEGEESTSFGKEGTSFKDLIDGVIDGLLNKSDAAVAVTKLGQVWLRSLLAVSENQREEVARIILDRIIVKLDRNHIYKKPVIQAIYKECKANMGNVSGMYLDAIFLAKYNYASCLDKDTLEDALKRRIEAFNKSSFTGGFFSSLPRSYSIRFLEWRQYSNLLFALFNDYDSKGNADRFKDHILGYMPKSKIFSKNDDSHNQLIVRELIKTFIWLDIMQTEENMHSGAKKIITSVLLAYVDTLRRANRDITNHQVHAKLAEIENDLNLTNEHKKYMELFNKDKAEWKREMMAELIRLENENADNLTMLDRQRIASLTVKLKTHITFEDAHKIVEMVSNLDCSLVLAKLKQIYQANDNNPADSYNLSDIEKMEARYAAAHAPAAAAAAAAIPPAGPPPAPPVLSGAGGSSKEEEVGAYTP